ncbi:hypothetical protein CSA56_18815 [candidate division KSB3 bacterium]|uniref:Ferredoxin n=1 Tax=candidate division KSB3 bacterium TaxID=2044937 RepID=A0A2G6K6I5_9BACT|nr:MAG: hypothetical protein CSA56_18815 [candidate division KSB3 bacterium]
MPGGDGTGPRGQGLGRGYGPGAQPVECVCPKRGTTVPHQPGVPCNTKDCPQCGERMVRK